MDRKKLNIISIFVLLVVLPIVIFGVYSIVQLVIRPTDTIQVERGIVTFEENVDRIHYKGRDSVWKKRRKR